MSERTIDRGGTASSNAARAPGRRRETIQVGCGMYLTVKDGKVVDVEGRRRPSHRAGSPVRALPDAAGVHATTKSACCTPLKRDPKDRGKDAWEEITWDEALDIIEERVNYVKQNWGAESIVAFQGTGREATLYKTPLAYAALGTPNSCFPMSGDSCYGPRCSVADFILGAGYPELDYAAFFPDQLRRPALRGAEVHRAVGQGPPLFSNPDGFFGHTLIDLMKRGSKYIVVDPRVTWIAAPCGLPPAAAPRHRRRAGPGHDQPRHPGRPVRPRLRGELVLRL